MTLNIALGADHAGYCFSLELDKHLSDSGHMVSRYGATSEEPYDYPEASDAVAHALLSETAQFGLLVCGSGIGVDIRANRYPHVRAANCLTVQMAELARQHNHANVLCLGARLMDIDRGKAILDAFLRTEESREPRHIRRVEKMDQPV